MGDVFIIKNISATNATKQFYSWEPKIYGECWGLYYKTLRITEKEKNYGKGENLRINFLRKHFSVITGKLSLSFTGKKCLWYSTPEIFSFSVKKESVKFYSTDPRCVFVSFLAIFSRCVLYSSLSFRSNTTYFPSKIC